MAALQIPDILSAPINTSVNMLSKVPPPVDLAKPVDDSIMVANIRQQYNAENPYKKNEQLFIPTASTPIDITQRYNDKTLGYSAFNPDIEHDYADHQSWYKALGINTAGFVTRGLATFLGGFSDIPDTIEAIGTGSLDAFTNTTYKNELSDWAESFSTKFPVYETRYTAEHPWMSFVNPLEWKSFTNRWGTVINNLGFTAGAIANAVVTDAAIGAVTEGVGAAALLPKQALTISKSLATLGKSFEYGKTAENLAKILASPKNILSELRSIGAANKGMNAFRTGFGLYNSAVGEASIEGYHTFKEHKQSLIDSYKQTHGSEPMGAALAEIEETAKSTGNATFLANAGLLMATNYLTFGKILKPTSLALKESQRSLIQGSIRNATLDAVEQIPKSAKLMSKFTTGLKNQTSTLGTMATEGFEEGAQYTISEGTKDYWTAKYKGSDDADDMFKSLAKGVQKTLFTREGMENVVMGALSGALINGFSTVKNRLSARTKGQPYMSSKNRAVESAIAAMNSSAGLTGSISTMHGDLSTQTDLQKRYEKAVAEGNVELSKTLKNDAFFNWIHSASKNGMLDLRLQSLEDARNLKDEEFANFWGFDYSESNSKTASNYISLLEKKAREYAEISDSVEDAFGKNPFAFNKQPEKYQAFENYKQALAHTLVEVKDSANRFDQLKSEINTVLPALDVNIALNLTTKAGLNQTIYDLNKKIDSFKLAEESTETLPELKSKLKAERTFLEEQVNTLNDYVNGRKDNVDEFSTTFRKVLSYLNDPTSINRNNYPKSLDDLFEKLNALNYLKDRTLKANKYYETLRNKDGFENFSKEVQAVISQSYLKRLEVKDGKLYIKSSQQVLQEKQKEIEELLKEETDIIEDEAEKLTEEQIPLADLPPLVDDQLDYEAALEKIEEGKEDTLTEKEKEAYEAHTAHAKRAALKEEIKKKLEEEKVVAPTTIKASNLKVGDEVVHNTKVHKVKEINENTDGTIDNVVLTNPEGTDVLVANVNANKDNFAFNLPTDTTINMEGREVKIKPVKAEDSTILDNLFGNVTEYVASEEETVEFNKVRENIENPSLKMVSDIYTNFIVKSAIFKFIFGDKLNVDSAKIIVRKYKKEINELDAPSKIGNTGLYRKRSPKEAILYINDRPTGYVSNSENLMIVRDGKFIPLSTAIKTMTVEEYVAITKSSPESFQNFKDTFEKYNAMSKQIFDKYDETKEVEINEKTTKELIKLKPSFINAKIVNKSEDATLLKNIKALGENNYIISVRRVFKQKENQEFDSTREINIIGEKGILTQEQIDADTSLSELLADTKFVENLLSNNSRYSLLNRLPNGKFAPFSRVVARPVNLKEDSLNDLFTALKTKDTQTATQIIPTIFMAEGSLPKGSGLAIEYSMNVDGVVSLNINQEKIGEGVKNVITIDLTEIAEASDTVEDFLEFINLDLDNQKRDTFQISNFQRESFKRNIKNDETATFSDFMDTLSVATTPYFYNKIKLTITPRDNNISEQQPGTSNQSNLEAQKTEILQKKEQALSNIKPVYHHTNVEAKDFDFNNFQRGDKQVSQFGDGLNASSNTTLFLVNRYGKPIQGEVNDSDFVKIDASKTEKEVYEELKKQGYKFSEKHESNDVLAEEPGAAVIFFTDFQKSNPSVKGVSVSNHIIGTEKVAPFYVIYDAKSFYGQGTLSKKIEQETNDSLKALDQTIKKDENKTEENLVNPNIVRIFAKDYDINDVEGIAKAKLLAKELKSIIPQLIDNNTIKRTDCK